MGCCSQDRLSAYSFWSAVSLADCRISYQLQHEWLQVLKSLLRSTCLSQRESEIDRITCSSRDRPLVCIFVLCKYTHSTSHRANKHIIEKKRTNAYWLKVVCKTKCKYTQSQCKYIQAVQVNACTVSPDRSLPLSLGIRPPCTLWTASKTRERGKLFETCESRTWQTGVIVITLEAKAEAAGRSRSICGWRVGKQWKAAIIVEHTHLRSPQREIISEG